MAVTRHLNRPHRRSHPIGVCVCVCVACATLPLSSRDRVPLRWPCDDPSPTPSYRCCRFYLPFSVRCRATRVPQPSPTHTHTRTAIQARMPCRHPRQGCIQTNHHCRLIPTSAPRCVPVRVRLCVCVCVPHSAARDDGQENDPIYRSIGSLITAAAMRLPCTASTPSLCAFLDANLGSGGASNAHSHHDRPAIVLLCLCP